MNRRVALTGIIVLSFCALSACVSRPIMKIDAPSAQTTVKSNTTITLVDKRPASDRESSIGSLMISSDRYGIFVFGDKLFSPTPAAALTARIEQRLATMPSRPSVVTLTLSRFNTQENMQASLRNNAISASGLGWLGEKIAEGILGKLREQNVDALKPFILTYAEMDVTLSWPDKPQSTRQVSVVKASNYGNSASDEHLVSVRTVSAALDALADMAVSP